MRFADIDVPLLVHSDGINRANVSAKLLGKDDESYIVFDLVQRDTLWVFLNVPLEMVFLFKGGSVHFASLSFPL